MLDSLAIMIALINAPVARPNMDRQVRIVPPAPISVVAIKSRESVGGSKLTTCFENRSGSCWSEN